MTSDSCLGFEDINDSIARLELVSHRIKVILC